MLAPSFDRGRSRVEDLRDREITMQDSIRTLGSLLCLLPLSGLTASPLVASPSTLRPGQAAVAPAVVGHAAQHDAATSDDPVTIDAKLLEGLQWRLVGPFRGGRVAAVCGVVDDTSTYWFGGTGGGVYKSVDKGRSWQNVSDGYFGGSIGAVEVAPSDPNVVYVGGGEVTVRGNVSHGDGIWKSNDAGKTWQHMGLSESRHVPRLRVHPRDPDLVYAAVLGDIYRSNDQRGVYRSKDGGKTWARLLFVDADVGAVDLCMDPSNPRRLYACMWRVRRTPWELSSGGEGSSIWKTSDGGETWTELTKEPGMPEAPLGISGIAVCPSRPDRVYAIVEAAAGGVFRSDDGGESWQRVNEDRALRQRAWYYTRIYADPVDADTCYVVNVQFWKSKDGGKSFSSLRTPHGDNHDLWIDPKDPRRMVEGNDGGACVSDDGGATWSGIDNQPTAQFYRVTTDNAHPYRILGGQQDNSTVRIASRGARGGITERDWEPTAGGESAWIAVDPTDPDLVFGGSYGGYLSMVNHRTGERRNVNVWPRNPMGHGAKDLRYRFQWNFPIVFSPHAPHDLYAAAQVLFRSNDRGQSWQPISPDLTRNEEATLGASGGPITKDNTGVEYYATIFAFCESPRVKGLLWCGSDDGLLHVSKNDGADWENVTPKGLPEWTMINSIEAHPFVDGGLYVAGTRYKLGDFEPYLYATVDYGQTWRRCDASLPRDQFTRVIRADPVREGLLYAGTERGVWLSFDDGRSWQTLQRNLPIVPITDLTVKDTDLVAATQGRAFWVLDDLTPLRTMAPDFVERQLAVFDPRTAWRDAPGGGGGRRSVGQNPPAGVVVSYWLKDAPTKDQPLQVEVLEEDGTLIRRFSTDRKNETQGSAIKTESLKAKAGMNRFVWDLRYPGATTVPGMVLWGGGTGGPLAQPGDYRVRFSVGDATAQVAATVEADPKSSATREDLKAQFDFLVRLRDKVSETHEAIIELRKTRDELGDLLARIGEDEASKALEKRVRALQRTLTEVEEALYQTKNRAAQDPLNYPIRLNNELSALASVVAMGSFRPTDQAEAVRVEVTKEIDAWLAKYRELIQAELPAIEDEARAALVPALRPIKKAAKQAAATGSAK